MSSKLGWVILMLALAAACGARTFELVKSVPMATAAFHR